MAARSPAPPPPTRTTSWDNAMLTKTPNYRMRMGNRKTLG